MLYVLRIWAALRAFFTLLLVNTTSLRQGDRILHTMLASQNFNHPAMKTIINHWWTSTLLDTSKYTSRPLAGAGYSIYNCAYSPDTDLYIH